MAECLYAETANSIAAFCREANFTPSEQQALVLMAGHNATMGVPGAHRRIAVASGQGVGKTACSVLLGLWRAWRRPNAKTFVTAPTMRQCRSVWLAEAAKRIELMNPWMRNRFTVTGSRIIIGKRPGQWGIEFFTATKAENAQGLHNEHMTVICEEASGIPRPLIEQIEGTLKNEDYLWLQIGNPNTRTCAFYDCFTSDRRRWHTMTLDARNSPVTDKAKIQEQIEKYGPNSDFVRVRIYGQFPNLDPDCIIDIDLLQRAALNEMERCAGIVNSVLQPDRRHIQFGLDFARYGSDENVLAIRVGSALFHLEAMEKVDPHILIARAFEFQAAMGWSNDEVLYVVDASGMGQGLIYDFLRAGKEVLEFHNNGTAYGEPYKNKITEAYYEFRDCIRDGGFSLLDDPELFIQFSSRKYWLSDKDGKIELESKDEYKKREGNSPDRADAVAMAFYSKGTGRTKVSDGRTNYTPLDVRRRAA